MNRSVGIQMLLIQHNLLAISVAVNYTFTLRKLGMINNLGIVLVKDHIVIITFLGTTMNHASRVLDADKAYFAQSP